MEAVGAGFWGELKVVVGGAYRSVVGVLGMPRWVRRISVMLSRNQGIRSVELNKANYPTIRQQYLDRNEFEIQVDIQDTAFSADNVPVDWSECRPPFLEDIDLVNCLVHLGDEMRDRLTRLELVVHYAGGKLLYKSLGGTLVGIKVTWPRKM